MAKNHEDRRRILERLGSDVLDILEKKQMHTLVGLVLKAKQELRAIDSAAEAEAIARQAGTSELRWADRMRFLLECRRRCGPGSGSCITAIDRLIEDAMRKSPQSNTSAKATELTTGERTDGCQ